MGNDEHGPAYPDDGISVWGHPDWQLKKQIRIAERNKRVAFGMRQREALRLRNMVAVGAIVSIGATIVACVIVMLMIG